MARDFGVTPSLRLAHCRLLDVDHARDALVSRRKRLAQLVRALLAPVGHRTAGKLARYVLRGEDDGNIIFLPDCHPIPKCLAWVLSKSVKEYSIHSASLDGDDTHRGRFAHD